MVMIIVQLPILLTFFFLLHGSSDDVCSFFYTCEKSFSAKAKRKKLFFVLLMKNIPSVLYRRVICALPITNAANTIHTSGHVIYSCENLVRVAVSYKLKVGNRRVVVVPIVWQSLVLFCEGVVILYLPYLKGFVTSTYLFSFRGYQL